MKQTIIPERKTRAFLFAFLLTLLLRVCLANPTELWPRASSCTPTSYGVASQDDAPAINSAIAACGAGGIIIIPAGKTYMILSTVSFAGCTNCDFQIEGTLKISDDLTYWEGKTAAFYMSGVNTAKIRSLTGTGLIDGNGQPFWDRFAANSTYRRPTMFYITGGSTNIAISDLTFKNPPNVFHSITGSSSNITYTSLVLSAVSNTGAAPKNTDGFDIGASTAVTISNTHVSNQDDCIAFKAGAMYTTVRNITCVGSHGLSIGSLGGGKGAIDTVSNIYVSGANMINATKAAGIKLYQGGKTHGTAVITNVTFTDVKVDGSDYAVQIQSCYNSASIVDCAANPSTAVIKDVWFRGFSGMSSGKYGRVVVNLNCPANGTCGVHFEGFTVRPKAGEAQILCTGIDALETGVTCSGAASG